MRETVTIDTKYMGVSEHTAAYLMCEGDEAMFVDTNTEHAVPRLLAALEREDMRPEQVRYVFVTHAHLDHAGGAWSLMRACPEATLLAHGRAAPHLIDPTKLVASATKVYGAEPFARLFGEVREIEASRVRVLEDGEALTWGQRQMTFFETRGHANHHLSMYEASEGAVFTGDSFGLVYPWLDGPALVSSSPTDFDALAGMRSLEAIAGTGARRAYLGHFGGHAGLAAQATELREQLVFYGALVEQVDEEGLEGEALDARCAREVRGLFEDVLLSGRAVSREHWAWLETDIALNADGVAFAVRKRRYKASRG